MAHEQDHALNSTVDHLAGTNGTLLGTEASAIAEKPFGQAATASAIVQRQASGNITLPGTDPVASTDAVSKGYADSLISGHRSPVEVINLVNADLVTAPALGVGNAGEAYIVAGTGGAWVGYSVGDLVEWDGTVWKLVLAGTGTEPADNLRVVVSSSAAGATVGANPDEIGQYSTGTSTWTFTVPNDGDTAAVKGTNTIYANTEWIYDATTTSWSMLGGTTNHNSLTGLQGGVVSEYYHFTAAQHTELVRYKANFVDAINNTPNGAALAAAGWSVGDRGMYYTANNRWYWVYLDTGNVPRSVRMA